MFNISSNINISTVYSSKLLQFLVAKKKSSKLEMTNLLHVECDKFINTNIYLVLPTDFLIAKYKNQLQIQYTIPIEPVKELKFIKFLYPQGLSKLTYNSRQL
jgi:hypothetical protein